MLLTPKYVDPPKEGRRSWTLKTADNQRYFFDPRLTGMTPTAGLPLEVTVEQKGKWSVITSMNAPAGAGAHAAAAGGVGVVGVAPWWMPFVSNTVAHAISAGLCGDPSSVMDWAQAARDAAIELAASPPADDEGPQFPE